LVIKERGYGALLVPVPVWLVVVCGFLFSGLERLLNRPIGFNIKVTRFLNAQLSLLFRKSQAGAWFYLLAVFSHDKKPSE
jgi:hypothetical protein